MNKGVLGVVGLLLALLLGGCAGTGGWAPAPVPPPQEEPGAGESAVPAATLVASDGEQQAGQPGTRCWGGMCVDMVGIGAPEAPLRVEPGEALTFELTAGDPSSVNLRVLHWEPMEMEGDEGTRIIPFDAPVVASGDLDPARLIEWQAPDEPGEYALALFSSYQEGGDISYGWHIVVE